MREFIWAKEEFNLVSKIDPLARKVSEENHGEQSLSKLPMLLFYMLQDFLMSRENIAFILPRLYTQLKQIFDQS